MFLNAFDLIELNGDDLRRDSPEVRKATLASIFLIESLRDHSVLSLVWVLSALCELSKRSFIFVEPMWFGFTRESTSPDAEADLLVIVDGEAMLCAVKSSW